MDYHLTRYEQETVVNFNNGDKTATIYTRDPYILSKLAKLAEKYPDAYKVIEEDEISKTYECSKKLIRFSAPPRQLSEEEKEINRQRLAQYAYQKQQKQQKQQEK